MAAVACGHRFNGIDGDCADPAPAKSISVRRLVLVFDHAHSCNWTRAGRSPGARRSLHVSSTSWIERCACLVELGPDQSVAISTNCFRRGGRICCWDVVDLVLETNDALA